jgi:hypothetical protein
MLAVPCRCMVPGCPLLSLSLSGAACCPCWCCAVPAVGEAELVLLLSRCRCRELPAALVVVVVVAVAVAVLAVLAVRCGADADPEPVSTRQSQHPHPAERAGCFRCRRHSTPHTLGRVGDTPLCRQQGLPTSRKETRLPLRCQHRAFPLIALRVLLGMKHGLTAPRCQHGQTAHCCPQHTPVIPLSLSTLLIPHTRRHGQLSSHTTLLPGCPRCCCYQLSFLACVALLQGCQYCRLYTGFQ